MTDSRHGRRGIDRAQAERVLLARLGLGTDASQEDLDAAHDRVVAYLDTAPEAIREWATRQAAAAEEAYTLLSDPAADLTRASGLGGLAAPAAIVAGARRVPRDDGDGDGRSVATRGSAAMASRRSPRLLRSVGAAVALVTVLGLGYAVYAFGAPAVPGASGTPAPEPSASAALDQAKLTTLMQKISANPKDVASFLALGNMYFDAGDYKTAGEFMTKALAVDSKNVDALIGLGAAQFDQGDSASAEKQWRAAIALDPKRQEAFYDLGLLYLGKNPPDMVQVRAMWQKVLDIDPTTEVAKSVKTHLDAFAAASPAPSSVAPSPASPGPASSAPASASPAPSAS